MEVQNGFRIWNKGDVQMVSSITLLSIHHLLLTKKDWKHKVELEDCIKSMYKWYLKNNNGEKNV